MTLSSCPFGRAYSLWEVDPGEDGGSVFCGALGESDQGSGSVEYLLLRVLDGLHFFQDGGGAQGWIMGGEAGAEKKECLWREVCTLAVEAEVGAQGDEMEA